MSISTRDKFVRDLNQSEAGSLLVHAHRISDERRKAVLLVRGPANAYFSKEEQAEIRNWIEHEDYPANPVLDEHPKRPTHWCNYHGHVTMCACDSKRKKQQSKASLKSELLGRLVRMEADLEDGLATVREALELLRAPEDQETPSA